MYSLHVPRQPHVLANPRWAEALFSDRRAGCLWLFVRVFVAWQWLWAGSHKLLGPMSVGWVRDGVVGGKAVQHGDKLLAFWQAAAAPPTCSFHAIEISA